MALKELQKPTPWLEDATSGCIVTFAGAEVECSGETHGELVRRRNAGPRGYVPDGVPWKAILQVNGVDHVMVVGTGKANPSEMNQIAFRIRDDGSQVPPTEPAVEPEP